MGYDCMSPSAAAGDHRPDHDLEFVDDVGGEQRLRDRDASVDADIASALLLEISNEFDQPAVDHRRLGPIPVKGHRRRDILRNRPSKVLIISSVAPSYSPRPRSNPGDEDDED